MIRAFCALTAAFICLTCHRAGFAPGGGCGQRPEGETTLTIREGSAGASSSSRDVGQLVVLVRHGVARRLAGSSALVTLLFDTAATSPVSEFVSARADTNGIAVIPTVSEGRYVLLVRHEGFDMLRRQVTIRAGHVDTARVTLATNPQCLRLSRASHLTYVAADRAIGMLAALATIRSPAAERWR